jgi:ubiquinone/menaquinone biosynthesis C-methylase UbiE
MLVNTDKDWEFYGKSNPYFGVVSHEEFRTKNLSEQAFTKFFDTGKEHIEFILNLVKEHIAPDFKPSRALDFGCGVGRLVIPLSSACSSIVGIDVSDSMLQEARKNAQRMGITNVDFIKGDDTLSGVSGTFNLVHSYIVFQHIPCDRGEILFQRLIDLLEDGGIGVLHFTYNDNLSFLQKTKLRILKTVPFAAKFANILKKRPANEPLMQMNEYNLNTLLSILQKSGCKSPYLHFTRHSGHFDGVILCFQK